MTIAVVVVPLAAAAQVPDELLTRKCTTCHTTTRWEAGRHTWIGWWWLTARMRWINGAALDWSEHVEVVDRLAARYPARGDDARDEWLLAALAFAPLAGLPGATATVHRAREGAVTAATTARTADAWIAVEPDGRVRLLPPACIALRLDATACAACRDACPVTCVEVAEGKFVVGERCIGCGHCAAACPTGALAVKGLADVRPAAGAAAVYVECLKVPAALAGAQSVRVPCLGGMSLAQWLMPPRIPGDAPAAPSRRGFFSHRQ